VAATVGRGLRHHDDMADAGLDLLQATRAEVRLPSLKGMDAPDLDRAGDAFGVIEAPR
jgi:hypothetical protein